MSHFTEDNSNSRACPAQVFGHFRQLPTKNAASKKGIHFCIPLVPECEPAGAGARSVSCFRILRTPQQQPGKYLLLKRDFMNGHVSCLLPSTYTNKHTHTQIVMMGGGRVWIALQFGSSSWLHPVRSSPAATSRKEETLPPPQGKAHRKRGH